MLTEAGDGSKTSLLGSDSRAGMNSPVPGGGAGTGLPVSDGP